MGLRHRRWRECCHCIEQFLNLALQQPLPASRIELFDAICTAAVPATDAQLVVGADDIDLQTTADAPEPQLLGGDIAIE